MRTLAVETIYRSRGNRSPGVDGMVLTRENLISELKKLERNQLFKYKSSPIRRVYIPKSVNELRPLGIPTISDRVMQTLFVQLLNPIVEANSDGRSYGYRRGRSAHQAIGDIANTLRIKPQLVRRQQGQRRYFIHTKHLLNMDIKGFFDQVSHD